MLRRRRRGENGQALALVLGFIAVFTLIAYSIVGLARAVEGQRASTETTAVTDASAEGSGQFSMADVGAQQCGAAGTGTMNFGATADGLFGAQALTYNLASGGCTNSTTGGNAPGAACVLCLLNTPSPNPATTVLNTNNKTLSVTGEVDLNGSSAGHGLTATTIGQLAGATCASCSPAPTTFSSPFADPLAHRYPTPATSTTQTCCGATISPGVYSGTSTITSSVFMTSGTYVLTGSWNLSGSASLSNNASDPGGLSDSDSGGVTDSDSGGQSDSDTGMSASGSGSNVSYTKKTLADSGQSWTNNQWAGAQVTVTLTGGSKVTGIVASNNKTTLTMTGNWSTTPSAGNAYTMNTLFYTANTLVDTQKAWTANQWAGAQVTVTLTGGSKVTGIVQSNTATTLTMTANWSTMPAAGNPYTINGLYYTASTLVDTGKSWTGNQWAGAQVVVTLTGGSKVTGTVQSNTATTLTMTANWSTTPEPGNAYTINTLYYSANTLVDTQRAWTANQWAGALVTVTLTGGSKVTGTVQTNTATKLTMTTNWSTTPAAGNAYTINTVYYTSNTLVDTQQSWATNQWAGATVTVTVSGSPVTGTVASNTSDVMTLTSNWSSTPPPGSSWTAATPVVFYLACPTSAPYWSCASAGQSGGNIVVSGQASITLTPPPSGQYAGVAVFADPNLTDPSSGYVLDVSGNGGSLGGIVYVPRGTLSISGGGSSGTGWSAARLVVQDLIIAGNPNAKLALTAGASLTPSCYYYNEALSGTAGSFPARIAQLLFEEGCGSAGINSQGKRSPTTVVSFNYIP